MPTVLFSLQADPTGAPGFPGKKMYQKIRTGLSGTMPARLMGRDERNGKDGSLAFLQGEGSWTKEASWLYFRFLVSLFKGKMKEKPETWPVT